MIKVTVNTVDSKLVLVVLASLELVYRIKIISIQFIYNNKIK